VENKFITRDNATHFKTGNIEDLMEKILYTLNNSGKIKQLAEIGQKDILTRFNWDTITDQYIKIFSNK
jgi:glycosyltransferase involved in cell wall biosynthesis